MQEVKKIQNTDYRRQAITGDDDDDERKKLFPKDAMRGVVFIKR